MQNHQMVKKRIIVLCDIGVGGERGRVLHRCGVSSSVTATEYKDPMKVVKRIGEEDRCVGRHRKDGQRKPR